MTVLVHGMKALGDNLFQRPYIKRLQEIDGDVYVETPWPQLYSDLNVKVVRAETKLRSAKKNAQSITEWSKKPTGCREIRVGYTHGPVTMGKSFGWPKLNLPPDLPPDLANVEFVYSPRPVAVVRPVTQRVEWDSTARDPYWGYINNCAMWLMNTHYVVLVGDLADGQEKLVGDMPSHHKRFMHGQLSFVDLIHLIAASDVLVSGVGYMVPLAVALQKKAFIVLGGYGQQNDIDRIVSDTWKHQITFARPKPFCDCNGKGHVCSKLIPDFVARYQEFCCA